MAEPVKPSKELIKKSMDCTTPEEIIELAKTEGIVVTKKAAEEYLAMLDDIELGSETLQNAAGGGSGCDGRNWHCWENCSCFTDHTWVCPEKSGGSGLVH